MLKRRNMVWVCVVTVFFILLGGYHLVFSPDFSAAEKDTAHVKSAETAFAQNKDEEAIQTETGKEESKTGGKSFFWFIKSGGIFMWPICIGSILALGLTIEHFMTLKISRYLPPPFIQAVKTNIQEGNIDGAKALCEQKPGPLQDVIKATLGKFGHGKAEMEKIAGEVGYRKAVNLNTKVSYLSWIAVLEPMLGLLGTVQGLIQAFMVIAEKSGMANPRALAQGVYAALITTAAGLIIAIPAMGLHFWFKSVVSKIMVGIEEATTEIIELLTIKEKG